MNATIDAPPAPTPTVPGLLLHCGAKPVSRDELAALMALAEDGIGQLTEMQKVAISA